MSIKLFSIRPLKWKKNFQDWQEEWNACVPMGDYYVKRNREDCEPDQPWEGWKWGYSFAEYHDEEEAACNSFGEGKQLAMKDWTGRITPALKEEK